MSCCLCQFEIGELDTGLLDLSMSHFLSLILVCQHCV